MEKNLNSKFCLDNRNIIRRISASTDTNPNTFKKGIRYIPKLNFISPVKRIFKLMVPAIFSNSVNQINVVLVNTIMASFLGEAAITYLYYGNRLMQLPLGIFGVAIATAAFPTISMHAANADIEK